MTIVETHDDHAGHGAHADGHVEHSDFLYIKVAIFLAVMTAVEVWLSYAGLPSPWTTVFLIALMILKFWTVVSFFMHLRWDHRLFSYLFYAGLFLSIAVYVAFLTCFQIWSK
jgi:cytochrome c oxidase subunit IV